MRREGVREVRVGEIGEGTEGRPGKGKKQGRKRGGAMSGISDGCVAGLAPTAL